MSHYFTDDGKQNKHDITVSLLGKDYVLASADGMFSKDKLDTGSKLLIEESHVEKNAHVLDLGCGIGVVGLLLAQREPSITLMQTDVTDKAIALTQENAKRLGVPATIIKSDVYDALQGEKFDVLLCNPPRAAGKTVIKKMIEEAPNHLNENGSLQLVAMTNKGGETYAKLMKEIFGNVETIARGSGFKVYKSVRR